MLSIFEFSGCIAYAHIPDAARKKLDDKGQKCIFLGISDKSKAYRLFNPITKKIVVSRDVIFDEEALWNWSDNCSFQHIPFFVKEEEEPEQPLETSSQASPIVQDVEGVEHESGDSQFNNERPQQNRGAPRWLENYKVYKTKKSGNAVSHFSLFLDCDPISFADAVKDLKWQQAMDKEIRSIEKNDTWELTNLPENQKGIGVKWVYKTKLKENGEVDKFKARLVAKGYKQEYGVDYVEMFAPIARLDTIRLVIVLAAQNAWKIFQLDVKSTFLHGELQEHVFINNLLSM